MKKKTDKPPGGATTEGPDMDTVMNLNFPKYL